MKKQKQNKNNNQTKKWKAMTIAFGSLAGLGLVTSIAAPIIVKNSSKPIIESDEVTINFTGDVDAVNIVSKYGEKPRLNQDFVFYVFSNVEYLTLESATIGTEQLTISNGNEVLIPADLMNSKNISVNIALGLPKVKLTVDSAEGVTIEDTVIALGAELRIPVTCAPGTSITNILLFEDGKLLASSTLNPGAIGTLMDDDGALCIFIPGSYVKSYNISICIETEDFFGPVVPITGESKIISINPNSLYVEADALNFTFDISGETIVEDETIPTFKFTNNSSNPLNGVFFFTQQGSLEPVEWSVKDFTIGGGKEISFQPEIDWDEVTSMQQTYVPHFYAKQTLTGIKFDNDVDARSLKTTLTQTNPYTIYNFTTKLTKDMFENEVYKTARNNFYKFQVSYSTITVSEDGTEEIVTNNCPFTIIRKSDNLAQWEMGYWSDELHATEASEFYSSDEAQEVSIDFVLNQTIGEDQIVIENPTFELKAGYNAGYSSTILAQIGETTVPQELVDAGFDGYYRDWTFADAFIAKDGEWTPEFTFKLDYELGEDKKYNFKFIDLNDESVVKKSTTVEVQIKSNETLFSVKPNLKGFNLNSGMMNIKLEVGENITNAKVYTGYVEDEGFESSTSEFDINSTQQEVTVPEVANISGESKTGHFILKINDTDTQVASTDPQTYSGEAPGTDIVFNNIDWTNIKEGDQLDFHFVEDAKIGYINTTGITNDFESAEELVTINSDSTSAVIGGIKHNGSSSVTGYFAILDQGGNEVGKSDADTYEAEQEEIEIQIKDIQWGQINYGDVLNLRFIPQQVETVTVNVEAINDEGFEQVDGETAQEISYGEEITTINQIQNISGESKYGHFILTKDTEENETITVGSTTPKTYDADEIVDIEFTNIDWNNIAAGDWLTLHFVADIKSATIQINNQTDLIKITEPTTESSFVITSEESSYLFKYAPISGKETEAIGKSMKITLTKQGSEGSLYEDQIDYEEDKNYRYFWLEIEDWSKIDDGDTLILTITVNP